MTLTKAHPVFFLSLYPFRALPLRLVLGFAIFAASIAPSTAGPEDLLITEVVPTTGQVEVTNTGVDSVTLDRAFPFCHRFNYSTSIPNGTIFAAGEAKVFTVSGLNATDTDLWLYRNSSFGSADAMLTGLKWGPAANVGRTSVAVTANLWSAADAFVDAPAADQSLQLMGADPSLPTSWVSAPVDLGTMAPREPNYVNVRVTFTNNAPANGNFLTPPWVGFHNGEFDSYDSGAASSEAIERIAEDGNVAPLSAEFLASGVGVIDGALNGIGPIAPGATVSKIFTIDANSPMSQHFSYATMIIPSNDAYVANGNPVAHRVFDDEGNFIPTEFIIAGSEVNDAGTEVNDELPENTAFFGQETPNTGETEDGVNTTHPGFNAPGMGGIRDDGRFMDADLTADGYQIATVKLEVLQPEPVNVRVTFSSATPTNGTFLTPPWVGFHDGRFDTYDNGAASSPALERLAEDGTTAPLSADFLASGAGTIDGTLNEAGPLAPSATTSLTFTVDANSSRNRFFSYVGMIIPSNDAYVANGNPMAHRLFDDNGTFLPLTFDVLGTEVNDAGTEVNDELPANTAFFGQAAPNTGVEEGGVNTPHPGFMAAGSGGILDDAMFASGDFTAADYKVGSFSVELLEPNPINVVVTVTNTAPTEGSFLTPPWVAVHDGSFDTYDGGAPSSAELERIAEDGNAGPLSQAFLASEAGLDAVLNDIGPLAPGANVSRTITIDTNSPKSRYFSYVSMIIPSNDAYVANGNPMAHRLVNGAGELIPLNFEILGSAVNDAGTEVNDEVPANTAFFGQMVPNTGTPENGVNTEHPGFNAVGTGGILDDARFVAADFTADGYQIAQITVEPAPEPKPVDITLTLMNNAPDNGVFLTPVWLGVHDGTFNLFTSGEAASAGLERLAEDGNTTPLSAEFLETSGAGLDTTVATNDEVPPFAPGESATVTLTLDANNPKHRYLSFASMVIPSNDAFIGNSDPRAYPIFDDEGNVIMTTILRLGAQVYDAGTEVNDETPANTAFFGQAAPDTGTVEGGAIRLHTGFNALGSGGILDDSMFANADFTAENYALFGIAVTGDFAITEASLNGNVFSIDWIGGQAPFQVQWSDDLRVWQNVGALTNERSLETEMALTVQMFFRVLEGAEAPPL